MTSSNQSNSENFERLIKASGQVGKTIAKIGVIESGLKVAEGLNKLIESDYYPSQYFVQFIEASPLQEVIKVSRDLSGTLSQSFQQNANNYEAFLLKLKYEKTLENDIFLERIENNKESIISIIKVKSEIFKKTELVIREIEELCVNLPEEKFDILHTSFCMELNAVVQLALRIDNELSRELNNYLGLNSSVEEVY